MQRRTFPSLIAFLALSVTFLALRPAAAQALTDEALIAKIDALAAKALANPGAAGLSVAVARGERVILNKGYGTADLELGVSATDSSVFRIASVTKQFTAAAILRLAERGRIALDDDFTKYVDYPTHGKTVTIRHLLTHTSGIKSYTDVPASSSPAPRSTSPPRGSSTPSGTSRSTSSPGRSGPTATPAITCSA